MNRTLIILLLMMAGMSSYTQELIIDWEPVSPREWPFINDMDYDQDSTLWTCDEYGEIFYRIKGDSLFKKFASPDIGTSEIQSISAKNANDIWIGVDDKGLYHFNGTSWVLYDSSIGLPDIKRWGKIIRDPQGGVWFLNWGAGLAYFSGTVWKFYNESNGALKYQGMDDIAYDSNGTLWAAADEYLYKFNGTSWSYTDMIVQFQEFVLITRFFPDRNGKLWIGTRKGLFVSENNVIQSRKDISGDIFIQTLAFDHRGVLWLAEFNEGLHRYTDGKKIFFPEALNVIPSQIHEIIIESNNEKIMIGTAGSSIVRVNDEAFYVSVRDEFTDSDLIKLIPNPVKDRFRLETALKIESFKLLDMNGRILFSTKGEKTGNGYFIDMDAMSFVPGMLLLESVGHDGKKYVNRIMVVE